MIEELFGHPIMAAVTTVNVYGFVDFKQYSAIWIVSLLAALPIGIGVFIIISLLIKPKSTLFWAKYRPIAFYFSLCFVFTEVMELIDKESMKV